MIFVGRIFSQLFKSRQIVFQRGASTLSILGIETSCDDTGIALVRSDGQILANVIHSQQETHLRYGGIVPPRAQELHRTNIESTYQSCLEQSGMDPSSINAIAVTTRPGLPLSLLVGLRYARYLARKFEKPVIPVHHMEAHATAVRIAHKVEFPYLALLISGGHSQLVFVQSPLEFYLLGQTLDDAPGEAFDKIARRLRLNNLLKYRNMNGGQAVEEAAKEATNPARYQFPLPLARYKDCNFSFAGIKNNAFRAIRTAEREEGTPPDGIIVHYRDFCAALLKGATRHICNRTQRALEFCLGRNLFKATTPSIVVSGGVANNDYIFENISNLASKYEAQAIRPPKQLCSDNGAMIAWNGIEKYLVDTSCATKNYDALEAVGKCTIGTSLIDELTKEDIKCKWVKTL